MRESLLDKDLVAATDGHAPPVRMLPDACVFKVGGRSIIDRGREALVPLAAASVAGKPELLAPALDGEHVGTIVHAD